jgi:hypothetical protein
MGKIFDRRLRLIACAVKDWRPLIADNFAAAKIGWDHQPQS